MYVVGFQLGRVWAGQEASQDQLRRVEALQDGRAWVDGRDDPAGDLRHLVDAGNEGFLDLDEPPLPKFVAGFIDGARSIR